MSTPNQEPDPKIQIDDLEEKAQDAGEQAENVSGGGAAQLQQQAFNPKQVGPLAAEEQPVGLVYK